VSVGRSAFAGTRIRRRVDLTDCRGRYSSVPVDESAVAGVFSACRSIHQQRRRSFQCAARFINSADVHSSAPLDSSTAATFIPARRSIHQQRRRSFQHAARFNGSADVHSSTPLDSTAAPAVILTASAAALRG